MKKLMIIVLLPFFFLGCTYKSILPQKTQALIPSDANKVILLSEIASDSLYNLVFDVLFKKGFRILYSDRQLGYLYTDGKLIKETILMRMDIKVSEEKGLAKLVGSADWSVAPITYSDTKPLWKKASKSGDGVPDFVYDNMVLILEEIPHKEIYFVKE
jgi:hypothetical protein